MQIRIVEYDSLRQRLQQDIALLDRAIEKASAPLQKQLGVIRTKLQAALDELNSTIGVTTIPVPLEAEKYLTV